jgi:hypothetical protein
MFTKRHFEEIGRILAIFSITASDEQTKKLIALFGVSFEESNNAFDIERFEMFVLRTANELKDLDKYLKDGEWNFEE